jgi:paraquat-inducible protein A
MVQIVPPEARGSVVECARCGNTLGRSVLGGIETSLAFSASALVLLLPAALAPLMSLVSFGTQRRSWLPSGVEALWRDGFQLLASLVGLFSVVLPFLYLILMVRVLGGVRQGSTAPLGRLFRWAGELRPWAMIEVYLVGCCIAYTRLEDVGTVHIDLGGWCLMAATFAVLLATVTLDQGAVWDALPNRVEPVRARRTLTCLSCGLLLDVERERSKCPRCGARLHHRKPATLQRTLALVIAGFLLYLPANLLPVLSIEQFGRTRPNTILSGVRELITSGLWPLAVLVFTASIVVPLMKLFGLSFMLVLTHRRSRRWLVGRTNLYRFIDFIGRWSSIDLFMISILVAVVQFGNLTRVRPESGAVAFGAVVVVTMLASRCFDPRVMWDATDTAA